MRHLAPRHEKAQPHVGGRRPGIKGHQALAILGADRSQQHILTLDLHMLFQRLRVGTDGQPAALARRDRAQPHPRIERQHAVFVDQQGVDVEFGQPGQIAGHLRDLQQRGQQRRLIGGWAPAVAGQQERQPAAGEHVLRQPGVERRQRHHMVLVQLDGHATLAEQHHRAEHGVRGNADNQFVRPGTFRHGLHGEAEYLRLRQQPHHLPAHFHGRQPELFGRSQVQRHAADVGLVDDLGRHDLQGHGVTDAVGRGDRLLDVAGPDGLHRGDAVGPQQRLGLRITEPLAAFLQRLLEQRLGQLPVRREVLQHGCGKLLQRLLVACIGRQLQPRRRRAFRCVVAGNAGAGAVPPRQRHRRTTQPAGQHRLGCRLDQRQTGRCNPVGRNNRRGGMDKQHTVDLGRCQQDPQAVRITVDRSVADDVDRVAMRPGGRQALVERFQRPVSQQRQLAAAQRQCIGGQHACTTAVGQHRQPLTLPALHMGQGFGRVEQRLQRVHAQHAGTPDGSIEHHIGAGQRTGVRGRRPGTVGRTAGLDNNHRLVARSSARRRHELARGLDRLHVHQDGLGAGIAGQVVDDVAEVHVGAVAQRDEMRKPDAAAVGPIQHGGCQRARLRHKGQLAGQGIAGRKTGIEPDPRHQRPDAVGPEDAQQPGPRRIQHGLLQRGPARAGGLLEPGRQHNGGARALASQGGDQVGHCLGRRADDGQVRRLRQRRDIRPGRPAAHLGMPAVDRPDRPLKPVRPEIAQDHGTQAALPVGGAYQGHRGGVEQGFEIAYAHEYPWNRGPTCPTLED